jgi:threonylcarbamoyladenosine tRNA methylthiotransferase MtaB
LHVFPYSPRDNTPAARMPQIDKFVIKNRAAILRQKGREKFKKHLANKVGQKDLILIEKNENERSIGKDQNFFNAIFNEKIKKGDIIPCIYVGVHNDMLMAKRI